ncbi:MAG TPA: hypothetical protein VFW94_23540 [Candidatus Acidoferrales bacterium]|nr:hypothetical protein [Candidatus Acidoferrales bacterium]
MNFQLSITLGNDAMQTGEDVIRALFDSLKGEAHLPLGVGVGGVLWDVNGNTVGRWEVTDDAPAQPTTEAIDLTPESLKTPDGIAKVNEAMRAFEDATVALANAATRFFDDWMSFLREALKRYGTDADRDGLTDDLHQIEALIGGRNRAQERFLRAVAGR